MYSLLIVDDEKWIREGIKAKLKGKDLKISKIMEAEDGEEALNRIEDNRVDLIITDIKMGEMTGLELIEKAKVIHPNIKYIIISGYADFDYAKKALDLQVSTYLLKPVKEQELIAKVEEVLGELTHKTLDRQGYLLEQRVNTLFLNKEGEYKLENFDYYAVAIIDIQQESDSIIAKETIIEAASNIKQECTLKIMNNFANRKQLILLMMSDNREDVYGARKWTLYRLFDSIRDTLNLSVTIGVSDIDEILSTKLYKQAKDALVLILLHGISNIYYYSEQKEIDAANKMSVKVLEKFIDCSDLKSINKFINKTFDRANFTEHNALVIKYRFYKIVRLIRYLFREKSIALEILNINYDEKEVFLQFIGLDQLRTYLINNLTALIQSDSKTGDVKAVIKSAIEFVDSYYDEDITVKDLSTRMGINSNYLSTLFKKETGKTFTRYLTDLRITASVKLLLETDANVSQIAKSVGYQDAQYFYRVFKKSTGKTPLSYRRLNTK